MKQIRLSREYLMAIVGSGKNVKFRLEALAFCLIVRHDYNSASINEKTMNDLRLRMGVGRDKTYKIVNYLEEVGLLRKVAKGYWQLGKLPKHYGDSKNVFIDGNVCNFENINSVIKYLYATILQIKKSQMYYMSSLKHMACGYEISGNSVPSSKEVKLARKKCNKLAIPEGSLLKNGFEADLSKHMGQSYATIGRSLGFSRAKSVYLMAAMEKDGLIKKNKKSKVVYVGKDAATVLKYKFDGSVYTQFGQSFLFLSKNKDSIVANFSNSYNYNITTLPTGRTAMYA